MEVGVDFSLCKFYFGVITTSTLVLGILVNFCEPYLPLNIVKTFRYGKFALKEELSFFEFLEVPKSYFQHFYLATAFIYYPFAYNEILAIYINEENYVTIIFEIIMDLFCGTNRVATVSATRVFIVASLLMLQVYRRLYDTIFVSVFSKAKMNIAHYLIGMTYYPAVMLILLSEAPYFAKGMDASKVQLSEIGPLDVVAIALFLWAWYHQHVCTVILANLRKNPTTGKVVNEGYRIPKGDWFEYLSSPHSTAEILMYVSMSLILLPTHSGWCYVMAWVLVNQVETILLSHWWYKGHFADFPKQRKALLPGLY